MSEVATKRVADPADPDTIGFIHGLLDTPVALSRAQSRKDRDDGRAKRVTTIESGYPDNKCWFNCVDYSTKNGIRVVFGWAIWEVAKNEFVAQHHAVVRHPKKGLLDVTLHGAFEEILFVPDDRVPFDFVDMRYPFSYRGTSKPGSGEWFAYDKPSPVFAIAVMAKEAIPADVGAIVAAGKAAGVI